MEWVGIEGRCNVDNEDDFDMEDSLICLIHFEREMN